MKFKHEVWVLLKTKTIMKTFENLQAEVVKLGEQSKETSAKIDLKESYKGIETFDADLVIDKLNMLATYHENLSVKYKRYSKDYLRDEAYAKENKLGIWKGSFERPEKWRKLN